MAKLTDTMKDMGMVFTGGLDHCLDSLYSKKPIIKYNKHRESYVSYYRGAELCAAPSLRSAYVETCRLLLEELM